MPEHEIGLERGVYWPLGKEPDQEGREQETKGSRGRETLGLREADEGERGREGVRKRMARNHKPSLSSADAA